MRASVHLTNGIIGPAKLEPKRVPPRFVSKTGPHQKTVIIGFGPRRGGGSGGGRNRLFVMI